jgi:hypothetical protein
MIIMKKIYTIALLVFTLAACKSISMNPNKGSFNSGTIGSVRSTDNIPVANAGTVNVNLKDTSHLKADTTHRNLR